MRNAAEWPREPERWPDNTTEDDRHQRSNEPPWRVPIDQPEKPDDNSPNRKPR